VHLRRAILLFALVLGLTALAAAVSPTRDSTPALTSPAPAPAPSPAAAQPATRTVAIDSRPGARAVDRSARQGDRVVLRVSSTEGGQITIPRLGRTDSVSPAAPAQFDLLAPSPGRYDVLFAAAAGAEPRRVGTLVTHP
jgi:hypothetical protein